MLKKLIILVFTISIIYASSDEEYLYDMNQTYSKHSYDIYQNPYTLDLSNFDNNNSVKVIKKEYEKILPKYLHVENLYSKENLKKYIKKDDYLKVVEPWIRFIGVSLDYSLYLQKHFKGDEAKKIMTKILLDTKALMSNSDNHIMEYLVALASYDNIYSHKIATSDEIIEIIKKYPMPDESKYFDVLKADNDQLMDDYFKLRNSFDCKGRIACIHGRTMQNEAVKKYIEIYYHKKVEAIKDDKVDEFHKYMEQNSEEFRLSLLRSNKEERMIIVGKAISKMLITAINPIEKRIYQENVKIFEKYNLLVSKKVK